MNSIPGCILLPACLLLVAVSFSPATAGVLRYEDPWSRPNNYRQLPATQDDEAGSDVFNMYENQKEGQGFSETPAPPEPPVRSPMRFDTYEDQWYNRM